MTYEEVRMAREGKKRGKNRTDKGGRMEKRWKRRKEYKRRTLVEGNGGKRKQRRE